MSTFLWKCAAMLIVLFSLFIGGARLLPTAQADLSAFNDLFHTAPTCPDTPCLLGIHPELTPLNAALRQLEQHPWVGAIHPDADMDQHSVRITWEWSGQQPSYIDQGVEGILNARFYYSAQEYRVTNISLRTNLRFDDLRSSLPQTGGLISRRYNQVNYNLSYPHDPPLSHTTVAVQVPCPMRLISYWHANAIVSQGTGQMQVFRPTQSLLHDLIRFC